jgi:hypothetical protein
MRYRIVNGAFVAGLILVTGSALFFDSFQYRASCMVSVAEESRLTLAGGSLSTTNSFVEYLRTLGARASSDLVLAKVANALPTHVRNLGTLIPTNVSDLRACLDARVQGTNLLRFTAKAPYPFLAQTLAELWADSFVDLAQSTNGFAFSEAGNSPVQRLASASLALPTSLHQLSVALIVFFALIAGFRWIQSQRRSGEPRSFTTADSDTHEGENLKTLEISKQLQELKSSVAQISTRVSKHAESIGALQNLGADAPLTSEEQEYSKAVKSWNDQHHHKPFPLGDAGDISLRLKSKGLAYPLDTLGFMLTSLSRYHVLIVGSPGLGKSSLLQNFRECLSDTYRDPNSSNMFYKAPGAEWGKYQMLGGRWMKNGMTTFNRGVITNAVLECIKTGRPTCVLLDELSPAKLNTLFDPLHKILDMDSAKRELNFEELLHRLGLERIPVPGNFRIVCAMNPPDGGLRRVSPALRDRFQVIYFDHIDVEGEAEIMEELIAAEASSKNRDDRRRQDAKRLLGVVRAIRNIELEINQGKAIFGTRAVRFAIEGIFATEEKPLLDHIIVQHFLEKIMDQSMDVRTSLATRVFAEQGFHSVASKLEGVG